MCYASPNLFPDAISGFGKAIALSRLAVCSSSISPNIGEVSAALPIGGFFELIGVAYLIGISLRIGHDDIASTSFCLSPFIGLVQSSLMTIVGKCY